MKGNKNIETKYQITLIAHGWKNLWLIGDNIQPI
jgi:hypothetical protein